MFFVRHKVGKILQSGLNFSRYRLTSTNSRKKMYNFNFKRFVLTFCFLSWELYER